jgi:ribose-phosphate pyrophosphokinase
MTTLAIAPKPLRRLFDRLDYAPRPRSGVLAALLEHWEARRAGGLRPSLAGIDLAQVDGAASAAFVFEVGEGGYALVTGSPGLDQLIGRGTPGLRLDRAPNMRGGVRMRRLLDAVCEAGEPILADFTLDEGGRPRLVEVLAAPLSDGGRVDAIVGGIALEPIELPVQHVRHMPREELAVPLVFALDRDRDLGSRIAGHLGLELAAHEEREFGGGEHKSRSLVEVRNRDAFVVASLCGGETGSANDALCRLLFFIGAIRDAGAARVTAVVPYLAYSRKDRRTKSRDPLTSRYVAQLFEAMGTDTIVTLEAHNPAAFENAFRCRTIHIEAAELFVGYFAAEPGDPPISVVSPDIGGAKRAEALRAALERRLGQPVGKAFLDKSRSEGVVSGDLFAGDVEGRLAIIVDDLIGSGTTVARAAAACRARGAERIVVAAAHAPFEPAAREQLSSAAIDRVVVTDSVGRERIEAAGLGERLVVLDTAEMFARAIRDCER